MSTTMSSTIKVTLPDGSVREVPAGTTSRQVAEGIGPGLARAALAARVNGSIWDLDRPIDRDASVAILTERDPVAVGVLRHSSAHIMATAVRELFPGAGIGFGPAIEDGFYYDFQVDRPFTPEDLEKIEAKMGEVTAKDYPFVREVVDRSEANRRFADDPLKLERISELGDDETITVYTDGPFQDLCRGPHIPRTGRLKHFKLLHGAGAYWRGDERRQMLQRIYGTAWFKKEDLDAYLHRLEEARKRDHRRVGRELDLFTFHPSAPGAAFWTERGTTIYNLLVDFVRERQAMAFREIKTPLLFNKMLWETSGHWGKYREHMFLVLNEETGALSGLTRVRQFAQDDCHVFLTQAQIVDEVKFLMDFILGYYRTFGLTAALKFATRPETRIGSDELWDQAEGALRGALEATGMPYELKAGDGAFYGPKIDFDVTDSIGRSWQLGTIQLDYNAPERFDLRYVGGDNAEHRLVVIHRAVSGSFERFIAILIEHFAGAFPVWLSPEQVRVIPISDAQTEAG